MSTERELTHHKEIDGVKYICNMMPGDEAVLMEMEIVQRIGRPAAAMLSHAFLANPTAQETEDLNTSVEGLIAGGLRVFLNELEPADALAYAKRAMNGMRAEGVQGDLHGDAFGSHFRGRTMHMWRVFAWSMEVNFADFFAASHSLPLIGALVDVAKKALSAQTRIPSSAVSSSRQVVSSTRPTTEDAKPG